MQIHPAGEGLALIEGDVRAALALLPERSVQCVVSSPPYYSLRAYGTHAQVWGGIDDCAHEWGKVVSVRVQSGGTGEASAKQVTNRGTVEAQHEALQAFCARPLCGAWRGEYGSEPLPDCLAWARGVPPCSACYVCHTRVIFRALRRVLRDDGVIYWNLGDSYAGSGKGPAGVNSKIQNAEERQGFVDRRSPTGSLGARIGSAHGESGHTSGVTPPAGWKAKDLYGIPQRVALAMQADGWWWRQDIVWAKPNPMPESITDRCTRSHEYVYMFSKREAYYFDAEAIKEPSVHAGRLVKATGSGSKNGQSGDDANDRATAKGFTTHDTTVSPTRNKRDVWTITTRGYAGAHFAVFPPDLVEPCIKSGTSEYGACAACGAPWRRVVEKSGGTTGASWHDHQDDDLRGQRIEAMGSDVKNPAARAWERGEYRVVTTGWRPTCRCPEGGTRPCLVLDPFAGSGTTLLVARALGRRAVGTELQPDYIRLALGRLGG